MSDIDNFENNPENIEKFLAEEQQMRKIREEVLKKYEDYRTTLSYLAADAPIEILCLPKVIENILLANGFNRVYDLINLDFTKIKGLGVSRCRYLTASLNQFFSML